MLVRLLTSRTDNDDLLGRRRRLACSLVVLDLALHLLEAPEAAPGHLALGLAAAAGRVPPELLRCRGQGPPRRQQPRHRRRYGCRSRAPQSNRTRNHRRAQSYRQRLRRPCQSPPSRYRHRHLLRVRARVGLLRLSVSPAVSGCAVRSENWNSKCAELRRLLAARVDAQIAFSKENARRVCAVLRRRYRSRSYGRLRGLSGVRGRRAGGLNSQAGQSWQRHLRRSFNQPRTLTTYDPPGPPTSTRRILSWYGAVLDTSRHSNKRGYSCLQCPACKQAACRVPRRSIGLSHAHESIAPPPQLQLVKSSC